MAVGSSLNVIREVPRFSNTVRFLDYGPFVLPFAAESKAFRIQSDLLCRAWCIVSLSRFAASGVNLAAN
jgi:hypothetical protein